MRPAEIGRLILATALLDYPIEQIKFREAVGIPDTLKSSFGSYDRERKVSYYYWPLADTSDGGSYTLKTYYSRDTMQTTGRGRLITEVEVIYQASSVGEFVANPNSHALLMMKRLKPKLKASGLTVREFTAHDVLRKYWQEALEDEEAEWRALHKKTGQTVPPTPVKP